MSEDNKIIGRKDGAVGHLIFNNPEKRNAFSLEMSLAAADVIDDFAADDNIRVIVLSGAGDKAFVSGGDISKFDKARSTPEEVIEYNKKSQRFRTVMRGVGKPTIAMIRGYCLGGGMAIALNCDLRICTEESQFGIPAARLGIGYNADGLRQLINLVGPSVAKDILFSGRRYSAKEALQMRIVNYVVPAAELETYVQNYANTLANNAPLSILSAKRVIDELVKDADKRDNELCERVVMACFASEDYKEGRRAFMEKRKPVFRGR